MMLPSTTTITLIVTAPTTHGLRGSLPLFFRAAGGPVETVTISSPARPGREASRGRR
jgi:hypothetical protein